MLLGWEMPSSSVSGPHAATSFAAARTRVVIHGFLTLAAVFIGAGAILLVRGDDEPVATTADKPAEVLVAPIASTTLEPKRPVVLPNIDDPAPTKASRTASLSVKTNADHRTF